MWPQLALRSARTLRHPNKVDDDDDDDNDDDDDDDNDDDDVDDDDDDDDDHDDDDDDDDDDDVSFRPLLIFFYTIYEKIEMWSQLKRPRVGSVHSLIILQ